MTTTLSKAIIAAVLLTACSAANTGEQASSTSSTASSVSSMETNPMISVDSPKPGDTVTSPLTITGQASGPWYFEASFPVKLYDDQGNLLSVNPAQAQGEWMTEDFVPFSVELLFSTSAKEGVLVLERDNPSGLPENDAKISIPVKFGAAVQDSCIATCPDGYEYRICTEDGHPINYFADPCMNHGVKS